MIFFIHGEDTYRSRQKLVELKNGFKQRTSDDKGFGITILDGAKLTMEELCQGTNASSFLTSKKFVIIENFIGKNSQLNTQKEITKYIYDKKITADENNHIIFWEETDFKKKNKWENKKNSNDKKTKRATNPLLAKLLKEKYIWHFPVLKNNELNHWLQQRAKELNNKITNQVASALIALVGNNLWQLDQELKKLIAYCQQQPITLKEINLLVRGNFDENIFRLTDAIGSQNKKLALQLLNQQLINIDPKEYPRIFSMIIRQFRLLIQVKDVLTKQTISSAGLAKQLGLHPFVVSKILSQTNKYTLEQLKNIYQKLLIIDVKTKTGQGGLELLLDVLITEAG